MGKKNRTKVLLVGPCQRKGHPLGGAIIAFEELLHELSSKSRLKLVCVSTTRPQHGILRRLASSLITLAKIFCNIPKVEVVAFFGSNTSLPSTVPVVRKMCIFFGNKPLIVRKFGGLPHDSEVDGFSIHRDLLSRLNKTLSKCSMYLPETRKAQAAGIHIGAVTGWMPNYRTLPSMGKICDKTECSHFVFVGQVRSNKGVDVLIEAEKHMPSGILVDVYGPLMDGYESAHFSSTGKVRYCGCLQPDQVIPTLSKYDAYVFPSTYKNEGHPGSLIEALACGLPVISTNVGAIDEVVTENEGILIDPGSSKQLADAIRKMHDNPAMFSQMRLAALKRSALFNTKTWAGHFVEMCEALASRQEMPKVFFEIND